MAHRLLIQPEETFFAVSAPGLAPLAAGELIRLGLLTADDLGSAITVGGVSFHGSRQALYRANLHLRTASRVLVRLGVFYAAAFAELRKKAGRLAWESYISPGQPIALAVTCRKSRLYHSGAVAERVAGAIGDRLGSPIEAAQATEEGQEEETAQLVFVRLMNDQVTISIDSSGELLHRRGYRLATAKAPLRETLAAAMLLASGWDAAAPLIDPFCGSGTIPIEAALLAAGIPPGCAAGSNAAGLPTAGAHRQFAFMGWPGFNAQAWEELLAGCTTEPGSNRPLILASDRDAGAIRIAAANAERAGVADRIEFSQQAVSAIEPPGLPGWVVTNPPYGRRVSANNDLRNLYAQMGNVLRARCPAWRVAILCSDLRLLGQSGLPLDTSFSTVNGGIPVRLGRGTVP
jgi:putative N6-adenine-specific DNA methylase